MAEELEATITVSSAAKCLRRAQAPKLYQWLNYSTVAEELEATMIIFFYCKVPSKSSGTKIVSVAELLNGG